VEVAKTCLFRPKIVIVTESIITSTHPDATALIENTLANGLPRIVLKRDCLARPDRKLLNTRHDRRITRMARAAEQRRVDKTASRPQRNQRNH